MTTEAHLRLDEVERKVCDIASDQLGIRRDRISPGDRIVEDLNCDSLDLVELFMEVEESFGVTLPDDSPNPVFKEVFTRRGFRLADLAELVYLVQGTGAPDRKGWRRVRQPLPPMTSIPFMSGSCRSTSAIAGAESCALRSPSRPLRATRGS